jgi:hypothetical protein
MFRCTGAAGMSGESLDAEVFRRRLDELVDPSGRPAFAGSLYVNVTCDGSGTNVGCDV